MLEPGKYYIYEEKDRGLHYVFFALENQKGKARVLALDMVVEIISCSRVVDRKFTVENGSLIWLRSAEITKETAELYRTIYGYGVED